MSTSTHKPVLYSKMWPIKAKASKSDLKDDTHISTCGNEENDKVCQMQDYRC